MKYKYAVIVNREYAGMFASAVSLLKRTKLVRVEDFGNNHAEMIVESDVDISPFPDGSMWVREYETSAPIGLRV